MFKLEDENLEHFFNQMPSTPEEKRPNNYKHKHKPNTRAANSPHTVQRKTI